MTNSPVFEAGLLAELSRPELYAKIEQLQADLRDVIHSVALSALRAQGGVRVKPLEWETDHVGGGLKSREYRVRAGVWTHGYYWCKNDEDANIGFEDEEEAKAAAQADYEQRIRSALEASPAFDERDTTHLLSVIADIREKTGVGAKPMLSELADVIAARIEASPAPVSEATHRHKKRGTEYVLIGVGKMQSEDWLVASKRDTGDGSTDWDRVDMREVAIYRSAIDPNEIWVRPLEEFNDGRFEALAAKGGQ
jgi:hypothetical protein